MKHRLHGIYTIGLRYNATNYNAQQRVWLSNGRWSNVWRFLPSKIDSAAPPSWLSKAAPFDTDGDGRIDILVEDLPIWFPGKPTTFRMQVLDPSLGKAFQFQATLNGETANTDFVNKGDYWEASFTGKEPRWIHYAVCAKGTGICTQPIVIASPTTAASYALGKSEFLPDTFLAPAPPKIRDYVWNILEPTILDQDYQALVDRSTNAGPLTITKDEDYGELKRHEWEHQRNTAFSWGILTADKTEELACVYIKPSQKKGYDAMVRPWVTKQGAAAGLEPDGGGVEPGTLPLKWATGGPNCMELPDWQVREYNPDFYILRQSGCTHYEKPFLYLLFGSDKALLVDAPKGGLLLVHNLASGT